jgi:hypothetical protein
LKIKIELYEKSTLNDFLRMKQVFDKKGFYIEFLLLDKCLIIHNVDPDRNVTLAGLMDIMNQFHIDTNTVSIYNDKANNNKSMTYRSDKR